MTDLLAEILGLLQGISAEPAQLHINTGSDTATVTLTLTDVAQFHAWCQAERVPASAQCERVAAFGTSGQHEEISALYDKPGRKMLVVCRVWPWQDAA